MSAPPNLYQRNGIWWARFKVGGTEYRFSLRTRVRKDAERRLKAERTRIEDEAHYHIADPKSWQAAFVAWSEDGVAHLSPSTRTRYVVSLDQLRPFLDPLMLHEINAEKLREIVKARRRVAATATLKRDLTAMSSVLEHAKEQGWIDSNPTLDIRTGRSMKERRDPITLPLAEEMATMEAAAPTRFRDAMEFARVTGMREEEIFSLKHTALNESGETIAIRGKRNKIRVIPYTAEAKAIIERQPRYLRSPWVFWHGAGERWKSPASRFGDIRRRVARKAAQAKRPFTGYRFHDYRHLFAVEFLRSGRGTIYTLQGLLGHDSIKTTEIYLDFLTPDQQMTAKYGVTHSGAQEQRSQALGASENG